MPIPRPYGRGPYGTGPYSRYRGAVYECAGRTGITFDVRGMGVSLIWRPWALTEITWSVYALHADYTWQLYAPCSSGTWGTAGACLPGTWTPPPACATGAWTPKDLT